MDNIPVPVGLIFKDVEQMIDVRANDVLVDMFDWYEDNKLFILDCW